MKVAVQGRVERRRFGHFITKQRKSSSTPTSSCPYVDHRKTFFSSSISSSSNTTIRPQWWLPPPPHHNHQPTGPTPPPQHKEVDERVTVDIKHFILLPSRSFSSSMSSSSITSIGPQWWLRPPPQHKEVDERVMALMPVDIKHFILLPSRSYPRIASDPPQHYPPPLRLLEEANDQEWIYIESGLEYINKEEEEEKLADEEELLTRVPVDIKKFILLPSRSYPRIPSDPPQHYPPPLRLLQDANDEEWIYLEGGLEKYEDQ